MGTLRKLFHLLPSPVRKAIIAAVDRAVPARLKLPYIHWKLRTQNALEEEMQWLPRLVNPAGIAIDVGANVGLYSYRLSKLCQRVEAFEPNQSCLAILQAYDAPNVNTRQAALSSEPGTLILYIPVVGGVMQAALASAIVPSGVEMVSMEVPKVRLDDFDFTNVGFVKIDVEGYELEVLAGAQSTIRKNAPVLLIEIEDRHQAAGTQAVFSTVATYGYSGFFVFEGVLQPIDRFNADYHQLGFLEGRQKLKYVNNFIFFPPGYEGRLYAER